MVNLMQRRRMMTLKATPAFIPIYELESETSTSSYDTGVKLFDTPKPFTILCEAKFANRGWSNVSNTNSIFGISTGKAFRVGAYGANEARDYRSGSYYETAKRYTALVMNASGDSDPYKMTSLFARMSSTAQQTHRISVRYNPITLKVEGFTDSLLAGSSTRWFYIDSALSSSSTLKFWLSSATGTMNIFRIYEDLLPDATINRFLNGTIN